MNLYKVSTIKDPTYSYPFDDDLKYMEYTYYQVAESLHEVYEWWKGKPVSRLKSIDMIAEDEAIILPEADTKNNKNNHNKTENNMNLYQAIIHVDAYSKREPYARLLMDGNAIQELCAKEPLETMEDFIKRTEQAFQYAISSIKAKSPYLQYDGKIISECEL